MLLKSERSTTARRCVQHVTTTGVHFYLAVTDEKRKRLLPAFDVRLFPSETRVVADETCSVSTVLSV